MDPEYTPEYTPEQIAELTDDLIHSAFAMLCFFDETEEAPNAPAEDH